MENNRAILNRAKYLSLSLCRKNSRISRGVLSEKSEISTYQIEKYEHGKKEIPYKDLDILLNCMEITPEIYMNHVVNFVSIFTKEKKTCEKQIV